MSVNVLSKDDIVSIIKECGIVSILENGDEIEFTSRYGSAGIYDNGPYSGFEYGIVYSKDGKERVGVDERKEIIDYWYFYSILRL